MFRTLNSNDEVVTMSTIECANCGVLFGVTEDYEERRRKDHRGFHCPNGHSNVYNGKSEAEKLRDELERQKRCCDSNRARAASLTEALEHRERQIRGYKGAVARRRNEIKALEAALGGEIEAEIIEAEQAIAAEQTNAPAE